MFNKLRSVREDIRLVQGVAADERPHLFALADAVLGSGVAYDCIVTDMARGYFPGRVIGDVATAAAVQKGHRQPTLISISNSGSLYHNTAHRTAIKSYLARVGAAGWARTLLVSEHTESGATASLLGTELEEAGTRVDFATLSAKEGGRYADVLGVDHPDSALYIGRVAQSDPLILSGTLRTATGWEVVPGIAAPCLERGPSSDRVVGAAHKAFDQITTDYIEARGLNR